MTLSPEEIFFRAFRHAEFDICELSLSSFTVQDRARRLPLCRRAGLRVARLPPHLDLCAHRPHQEAAGPQGQAHRRARISAHRQRLGARDPGGRLRREAVGHHLGARRHRGAGPAGEDRDQAAAGRAAGERAGRQTISAHAGRGEIDGFIAPRPPSLPTRHPNVGWLFPTRPRRPRTITGAPGSSRSCIWSACARLWPSSIRGCRPRC